MLGVTTEEQAERRERVALLWARGVSQASIARQLRCDRQTVARDVAALGQERADIPGERRHLLASARAIHEESWRTYIEVGRMDAPEQYKLALRLGALGKLLAAEQHRLAVLSAMDEARTERAPTAIDALLAGIDAPALPAPSRRPRAALVRK